MARFVRKKYIVNKSLQLKIFFQLLVFMFFVAILVSWTVYLGVFKTLIFELSGEKITLINKMISFRMALWFLPTVASIIIISVFLSHRIAGPIFVFQRTIKNLAKGDTVERVRLRKHDMLNDFASDLNLLIDSTNNPR